MAIETKQTKEVEKAGGAPASPKVKPQARMLGSERLRGANLRVLRHYTKDKLQFSAGASFREAMEIADKENLVLASNQRIGEALIETGEWKKLDGLEIKYPLPCWTGTMVGCAKRGEKIGKVIVYTDKKDGQRYILPVPEQYIGQTNVILVTDHPDYVLLQDGKDLVVQASKVDGLTQFLKKPGVRYCFGGLDLDAIPCGHESDPSKALLTIATEINAEELVVPIVRGRGGEFDFGIHLSYLDWSPSSRINAIFESPEKGVLMINECDNTDIGRVALSYAIRDRNVETVRFLLESGVSPNATYAYGETALMQATSKCNDWGTGWDGVYCTIVRLLIEAGADLIARDSRGRTALMIAEKGSSAWIIELLKAAGATE